MHRLVDASYYIVCSSEQRQHKLLCLEVCDLNMEVMKSMMQLHVQGKGSDVGIVEYKNISFTVWHVGGQDKIRPLWRHYFKHTHDFIFVVDINDRNHVVEAGNGLHGMSNKVHLCWINVSCHPCNIGTSPFLFDNR